jgi:hypothetical protein
MGGRRRTFGAHWARGLTTPGPCSRSDQPDHLMMGCSLAMESLGIHSQTRPQVLRPSLNRTRSSESPGTPFAPDLPLGAHRRGASLTSAGDRYPVEFLEQLGGKSARLRVMGLERAFGDGPQRFRGRADTEDSRGATYRLHAREQILAWHSARDGTDACRG